MPPWAAFFISPPQHPAVRFCHACRWAALGFAYFAASKFLDNTAFCRWVIEPRLLARAAGAASILLHPKDELSADIASPFQAGAARTLIGIAAGSLAGLVFFYGIPGLNNESNWPTIIFFALLIPSESASGGSFSGGCTESFQLIPTHVVG